MYGQNECKWLVLGKTTLCCRRCIGKYCFAHLAKLRNGGGTRPCSECGKGVKTLISLCERCGYYNTKLGRRIFCQRCFHFSYFFSKMPHIELQIVPRNAHFVCVLYWISAIFLYIDRTKMDQKSKTKALANIPSPCLYTNQNQDRNR